MRHNRNGIERRSALPVDMELRNVGRVPELRAAKRDKSIGTLAGYAAVFGHISDDLGGFVERIMPGAFDSVLGDDVRALVDHDPGRVIGRTASGTLRISVDEVGLAYEVDLPDTREGNDLATLIRRGDVAESSFGFVLAPGGDSWELDRDGRAVRTIKQVGRLYDVSPVAFPAYRDTSVNMRAMLRSMVAARSAPVPSSTPPAELDELRSAVEAISAELAELREALTKNGSAHADLQHRMQLAEDRLTTHSAAILLPRA